MISVLIPTLNRPGLLQRALRSLALQTMRDFEVIVVNDGGRRPCSVVQAWSRHLDLRLLELDRTRGAAHARNTALEQARGSIVAFLDDDVFLPPHLERAAVALRDDQVDAVYGGAVVSDRWITTLPRRIRPLPRKDYPFDDGFLEVANYIHTGSVVTRNFARTPVRFDERLTHCEDWDLWLALRRQLDYQFRYLGRHTSVYHQVPQQWGLVADGYRTTPTVFTRARTTVYDKWPATSSTVAGYRAWFREFDRRVDSRVAAGGTLPPHAFEHAVRSAHAGFTARCEPDPRWLDALFSGHGATAPGARRHPSPDPPGNHRTTPRERRR